MSGTHFRNPFTGMNIPKLKLPAPVRIPNRRSSTESSQPSPKHIPGSKSRLGSVFSQFSGSTLGNEEPGDAQPQVHLGHHSYSLTKLPDFQVLKVTTQSGDSKDPVRSRKLRYEAVKEVIKLARLGDYAVVQMNRKAHSIDRIIIPIVVGEDNDNENPTKPFEKREFQLTDTKMITKGRNPADPATFTDSTEAVVWCIVEEVEQVKSDPPRNDNYWTYLELAVRKYGSGNGVFPPTRYGIVRDFVTSSAIPFSKSDGNDKLFVPATLSPLERFTTIKVHLRFDPVFEKDGEPKLRLDSSLAPFVQGNHRVTDLLLDLFGMNILGPSLVHEFPKIKHILHGLEVQCDYQSPNFTQEEDPSDFNGSPGSQCRRGLIGRIQSVEISGNVPQFEAKNREGRIEKFSVHKYFKEVIKMPVRFPTLPYANLGKADSGKQIWIPLERLIVRHLQPLRRMGHLALELDEKASRVTEFSQIYIENVLDTFLALATWEQNLFKTTVTKPLPLVKIPDTGEATKDATSEANEEIIESDDDSKSKEDVKKTQKPRNGQEPVPEPAYNFALVYVAPTRFRETGDERPTHRNVPATATGDVQEPRPISFIDDVTARLSAQGADSVESIDEAGPAQQRTSPQQVLKLQMMHTITVYDREDLALNASSERPTRNLLWDIFNANPSPDVLFGVVDEENRSKADIENICAQFRKFGERKIGAVTIILKKRYLEDLFAQNQSNDYFPLNVLQKLNYMLGNTNHKEPVRDLDALVKSFSPAGDPDPPRIMFLGAHLSHPGSKAAANCPSVASIVGTDDTAAVNYPGSARLQPSVREVTANGRTKLVPNHHINDLQAMMAERFSAWSAAAKPTHVVFYRHSLPSHEEALENTIKAECKAIKAACGSPIHVVYVLVGRPNRPPSNLPDTYTYFETVGQEKAKSHQYIICRPQPPKNDSTKNQAKDQNLKIHDIQALTAHLTKNYQLAPEISVALPVLLAEKLGRRMFEYFHWIVKNDYDSVPNVVGQKRFNSGLRNAQAMVDYVYNQFFPPGKHDQKRGRSISPIGNKVKVAMTPDADKANVGNKASDATGSKDNQKTTVAASTNRLQRYRPWSDRLDDKMFYL